MNNLLFYVKKTSLYRVFRSFYFYQIYELIFNIKKLYRLLDFPNKYKELKMYKGIHKGERCFIVATGPSMTLEDLLKLKNEYTIGVNSLCKVFSKTGWETTYFGVQDKSVYKKLKTDIDKLKSTTLFVSSDNYGFDTIKCKHLLFPFNIYNQKTETNNYIFKFSDDIYNEVCGGFTIVYSMIQIAVYMGFSEIYLLGCDCNYCDDKSKRHFVDSGHYDPGYKTIGNKMIRAYYFAKQYMDNHDVKIFNATRGGMLEVFPRVELDKVLKNKLC